MDVLGLHTSTPVRCRHDSGFESYDFRLSLEISPVRKMPSPDPNTYPEVLTNSFSKHSHGVSKVFSVDLDKISRKLSFNNLSDVKVNFSTDSGIECNTNAYISKTQILICTETQYPTDENCNFLCTENSTLKNILYRPLKYICKDHTHEKLNSGRHNIWTNESKLYGNDAVTKLKEKNLKLDFLHELYLINCKVTISDILSYLSDDDLTKVSCVSKTWRYIVRKDKDANQRRKVYIYNKRNAEQGPNKENRFETASPTERGHKSAFTAVNVENTTKQPIVFDELLGKFDAFFQELGSRDQQALMKCPKCQYPAKNEVGDKYCCSRNLCKHEFCKKCLGPYLDNHACPILELNDSSPKIIISSKKSRKNLRRLTA